MSAEVPFKQCEPTLDEGEGGRFPSFLSCGLSTSEKCEISEVGDAEIEPAASAV
jgi:hypothetical protein